MTVASTGPRRTGARRAIARLVGRAAFACVFVVYGIDSVTNPGGRVDLVANAGLPMPNVSVRLNGVVMTGAALALIAGIRPRASATILAASLVPTTVVGHAYWDQEEPAARMNERVHFFKNVTVFGGAILVALEKNSD